MSWRLTDKEIAIIAHALRYICENNLNFGETKKTTNNLSEEINWEDAHLLEQRFRDASRKCRGDTLNVPS